MPAPDIAARSPVDPSCWLFDLGAVLAETERPPRWRAGAFSEIEDERLL